MTPDNLDDILEDYYRMRTLLKNSGLTQKILSAMGDWIKQHEDLGIDYWYQWDLPDEKWCVLLRPRKVKQ